MPSSAVCSITDPLESIKARVDASLAKMDAANGQTQRVRRPQSAQLAPPPPRHHTPASRPSTARSSGPAVLFRSRCAHPGPPQPPDAATTASRDLLAYARQRFESVMAAEDHEVNDNGLLSGANSPSGFSAASHQSHLTSKTLVSAYVTLTSSSAASGRSTVTALPALHPAQKEQHELRLRLLNDIRVRAGKQPVRMRHDRVAQELCQEGGLPSSSAVFPYSWPDAFRWRVDPQPRFEQERRAAQEQLERRLAAAPDLPEPEEEKKEEKEKVPPEGKGKRRPRGPPSVSSVGSTEKRKVQSAVRRVEREVGKLKAEAKQRAEAEAEAEAARLAEEEAAAAAEAGELGPTENAEEAPVDKAESLAASGPEDDLVAKTEADEDEEPEPCPEEVPDFLCPSSEEKSRQHEVRLWLRKTTYSNAPDFLPIY